MTTWLMNFFGSFPRLNFSFRHVSNVFMPDDRYYQQSIILWVIAPTILCLVLMVILLVIWSMKCCCRNKDGASRTLKRKSHVDRFACWLSSLMFTLCVLVSVCLYANERANRGVTTFVESIEDIHHAGTVFYDGLYTINRYLGNITAVHELMYSEAAAKSRSPHIDPQAYKNFMNTLNDLLLSSRSMSLRLEDLKSKTAIFRPHFVGIPFYVSRAELERWILFVILYASLFAIGIFGLVVVCKRSRKGSIAFGVAGLLTFTVGWGLAALNVGISLVTSDFCIDPRPYIEQKLEINNSSRVMFDFYLGCIRGEEIENPTRTDVYTIETDSKTVDSWCQTMDKLIIDVFKSDSDQMLYHSDEIRNFSTNIFQSAESLESATACSFLRREIKTAEVGLCGVALPNFALALLCTLIFCLILMFVLVMLSNAWAIFRKRMNEYMEVDNQDPFSLQRENSQALANDQSNIPADFYGTHVYNPRTRFASAAESETNGSVVAASAPSWRNTPPPAYDSMHRAQNQGRHHASRAFS